jgi:hypothetical protein
VCASRTCIKLAPVYICTDAGTKGGKLSRGLRTRSGLGLWLLYWIYAVDQYGRWLIGMRRLVIGISDVVAKTSSVIDSVCDKTL